MKTCAKCVGPRLWGGCYCARCGYAILDKLHPNRLSWPLRRELRYLHGYCRTGHAGLYLEKSTDAGRYIQANGPSVTTIKVDPFAVEAGQ